MYHQQSQIHNELHRARLLIKAKQIHERNTKADSWLGFDELITQLAEHHDPELINQVRQGLSGKLV